MERKDIKIAEELVQTIQAKQMEVNGLKDLYGFAISTSAYEIPQEKIDKLQKQYMDANAEFELAKLEVEKTFVTEGIPVNTRTNWNLDYNTGICTVTYEIEETTA